MSKAKKRVQTQMEKYFEELAGKGFVKDSGQRRRNPNTGESEIVWVVTELGKATEDWADEPARH